MAHPLASALFKAIQNTSEWDELRVAALLSVVLRQSDWQKALFDIVKSELEALPELPKSSKACGLIVIQQSFQIAVVKMALKVPGYQESLKTALTSTVRAIPGWNESFADDILRATMSILPYLQLFTTIATQAHHPPPCPSPDSRSLSYSD
jgi:hypothetical protein